MAVGMGFPGFSTAEFSEDHLHMPLCTLCTNDFIDSTLACTQHIMPTDKVSFQAGTLIVSQFQYPRCNPEILVVALSTPNTSTGLEGEKCGWDEL